MVGGIGPELVICFGKNVEKNISRGRLRKMAVVEWKIGKIQAPIVKHNGKSYDVCEGGRYAIIRIQ